MPTPAQLAQIHIARQQLGLDDDTYRTMLANVAGVRSAKDLTVAGTDKVLAHLKSLGWQPKASKAGRKPTVTASRKKQLAKLEALLTEAGRPWGYLTQAAPGRQSMVQRICGVAAIEWCNGPQLGKLIAALRYDAQRKGRRQ